jgi:hypothetical protein
MKTEEGVIMDEMRVKLSTNFMKNIVSKLLAKLLSKKLGYKIDIRIEDLDFWSIDGDTTVKLNVEAKLDSQEFKKLVKSIDI